MKKRLVIIGIVVLIAAGAGVLVWERMISTQPEQVTPKIYSEIFDSPIDPKMEPERHKAIYKENIEIDQFPEKNLAKYPQVMPSGYKLHEVKGTVSNDITLVYRNESGQTIEIFQGVGEIGNAIGIGPVETRSGKGWLWKTDNKIGLTLPLNDMSGAQIYIIGIGGVSKENLITIADSLSGIYP